MLRLLLHAAPSAFVATNSGIQREIVALFRETRTLGLSPARALNTNHMNKYRVEALSLPAEASSFPLWNQHLGTYQLKASNVAPLF
jgi:hypothetical protein